MSETFTLPKCLNIAFDGDREALMDDLMQRAFESAQEELVEKLGRIQGVDERVEAACEGKMDTETWLSHQIGLLLYSYISHRTGVMVLQDTEDQSVRTIPLLSSVITETGEVLGNKAAKELLRSLSYHADEAIEERFGRELS